MLTSKNLTINYCAPKIFIKNKDSKSENKSMAMGGQNPIPMGKTKGHLNL